MKKIFIAILTLILLNFSSYSEVCIDFFDKDQYFQNQNPNEWSYELQTSAYLYYFEKKDFNKIGEFYNFIERLKSQKVGGDMEFSNPVIIALNNFDYNDYLDELYSIIPEAFTQQNVNGIYSEAPIIFAIRTNILSNVKFFFDNEIPISMEDADLFGSFDRGGSRFKFGYNLLTAIENPNGDHIKEYLVSKGHEEEGIPFRNDYYLFNPESVFYSPGFNSKVIDRLKAGTKVNVVKHTYYLKNGYQWVKIIYDKNKEGWVKDTYLLPVTKKGEGI